MFKTTLISSFPVAKMANELASYQKLHILNLPLEIRLEIYSLLFKATPIYCSKFEPGILTRYVFERRGRSHRCFLRTRCGFLFRICKQIKVEAESVFEKESPWDLYSWPMYPDQLPKLASKTKHIICSSKRIEACFGSRADNVKFDCLQTVTIIDGSQFFRDLTDDSWPPPRYPRFLKKEYGLSDAISALRRRGVRNIVIRNGRLLYEDREINLDFRGSEVGITVRGTNLSRYRTEKTKDLILHAFSLQPLPMKFEFRPICESRSPSPYEIRVDYTTNSLEHNACPANQVLAKFNLTARVSVRDGSYALLGRSFDGRVLAKLTHMIQKKMQTYSQVSYYRPKLERVWQKAATVAELVQTLHRVFPLAKVLDDWVAKMIASFKDDDTIPDLEALLKEYRLCERHLKTSLYEWMGEREALDEVVDICEFLTVASEN